MLGAYAVQLSAQLCVVRRPDSLTAGGDFGLVRHITCCVDGRVVKRIDRAQARDALAGVEARTIGRAVQIDHVARMRGH